LFVCGGGIYSAAPATGENEQAKTEDKRQLGIIFDMPDNVSGTSSWVLVLDGKQLLSKHVTGFKRPMIIKDVPARKVRVVVIPRIGKHTKGLYAEKDTEIKKSGQTVVRLKMLACDGIPVSVKLLGFEGELLKRVIVDVDDVTDGQRVLRCQAGTDDEGKISFWAYSDREYQIKLTRSKPYIATYRSKVIKVEKQPQDVTWQLQLGPTVQLRFFIQSNGQLKRFNDIRNINVCAGKRSIMHPVRDGQLSLSKESKLLVGAEKFYLLFSGDPKLSSYEIVRNKITTIDDKQKQIVDVVLALRREAKVTVQCPNRSTLLPVRKILPRVYVVDRKSGRVVQRGRVGQPISLRFGQHVVAVWQPGYRLVKKDVTISNRKDLLLKVSLAKAPVFKGKVLGKEGKPVTVAAVRVVYPNNEYLRVRTSPIKKDGTFALSIDDKLTAVLVVLTTDHGGRIVKITKGNFSKVNEIRLVAPCAISGEIIVKPNVKIESKRLKWHIMWVNKDFPKIVISHSQVQGETHKGFLQPGTYISYLFRYGDGVPLGKEITITEKDKQKTIEPIVVTNELWAKKKSMHLLGVR